MSALDSAIIKLLLQGGNSPWQTKLSPQEEQIFRLWVTANKIPHDPNSIMADYDMRGYWRAMVHGDPRAQQASNRHFPDIWKTPYHKSFSNESIYATPGAPHWVGNSLVSPEGKIVFKEK